MAMLIVQPILIKRKQLGLHRQLGKMSYVLFPLMLLSICLVAHSRLDPNGGPMERQLIMPGKDIVLLLVAYCIAIVNRHKVQIHARAMVATGLVFIEPALVRFVYYAFQHEGQLGYFITIGVLYTVFLGLIVIEWKQKKGRWVFPLMLGLYMAVHSVVIFQIHVGPWQALANWFAKLPIT
jgi:hypothetical protein